MASTTDNNKILLSGEIIEVLPDTRFKVELENGQVILGYLAGKMRVHYIKLTAGDWVTVELSPYDLTLGRIVRRLEESESKRLSHHKQTKNEG